LAGYPQSYQLQTQRNLGGAQQSEAWRTFILKGLWRDGNYTHTFAITEAIDRNDQTKIVLTNPHDQVYPTSLKDQ
jgi:hypothetical protein